MKIFFNPDTKAIIAKVNKKFYSLPNLQIIDSPKRIIPCIGFLKEVKSSNWIDIPDEKFYEYLKQFSLEKENYRPKIIKIHKLILNIEYTKNEVGEPVFRLHGCVPYYVLNGIGELLIVLSYEE